MNCTNWKGMLNTVKDYLADASSEGLAFFYSDEGLTLEMSTR